MFKSGKWALLINGECCALGAGWHSFLPIRVSSQSANKNTVERQQRGSTTTNNSKDKNAMKEKLKSPLTPVTCS
jgi:hypothetical protein